MGRRLGEALEESNGETDSRSLDRPYRLATVHAGMANRRVLLSSILALFAGLALGFVLRSGPSQSAESHTGEPSRTARSHKNSSPSATSSSRFSKKLTLGELTALSLTEQAEYLLAQLSRDPAFALDQALTLYREQGSHDFRNSHLSWMVTHLARKQRDALLAFQERDDLSRDEQLFLKEQLSPGNLAVNDPIHLAEQKLAGQRGPGNLAQNLIEASREQPGTAFLLFERALRDSPHLLTYVADRLMETMAKIDPDSFRQLIDEASSSYLRAAMVQGYVGTLGKDDPEAAKQYVEALPFGRDHILASIRLANLLAQADPHAAKEWIDANLSGKARRLALSAAATPELIQSNPGLVLDWFKSEAAKMGLPGSDYFTTVVSRTSGSTSSTGWNMSSYRSPDQVVDRALQQLARTDPQAALSIALNSFPSTYVTDPFYRGSLAGRIMANWMNENSTAALTWLRDKDEQFVRTVVNDPGFGTRYHNATTTEMLEAFELTNQFEDSRASALAQNQMLSTWTKRPDDLVNLLDHTEGQLLYSALSTLAAADPNRAIAELHRLSDDQRPDIQSVIVNQLANTSPARALEYSHSLPETERRENVERSVLYTWAQNDIHGAHQWIRSQPSSPRHEQNVVTFANAVQHQGGIDHALLVPDIEALSDSGMRNNAYGYLIPAWAKQDRDAARQALQQANLTAQQRTALQIHVTPKEEAP